MMLSSAGVEPTAGNAIFNRPLNPTQSSAAMFSSGSVEITLHVDSSITIVNVPAASTRLLIVNETPVGVPG